MGRLIWYEHSKDPYLPEHAQMVRGTKTVLIPTDDSDFPPYYSLSHELAHQRLGHGKPAHVADLGSELEAVEQTIRQLKNSGEWGAKTRYMTIKALSGYTGGNYRVAREMVIAMEKRIDHQLGMPEVQD